MKCAYAQMRVCVCVCNTNSLLSVIKLHLDSWRHNISQKELGVGLRRNLRIWPSAPKRLQMDMVKFVGKWRLGQRVATYTWLCRTPEQYFLVSWSLQVSFHSNRMSSNCTTWGGISLDKWWRNIHTTSSWLSGNWGSVCPRGHMDFPKELLFWRTPAAEFNCQQMCFHGIAKASMKRQYCSDNGKTINSVSDENQPQKIQLILDNPTLLPEIWRDFSVCLEYEKM